MFPRSTLPPLSIINPWSLESMGVFLLHLAGTAIHNFASAAWPSANRAIFIPFHLDEPTIITAIGVPNGATATGNFDVGIYDVAGTKIVSSGSTAQAGTSAIQTVDITDTLIGPGDFYMAIAMDGTSGTMYSTNSPAVSHLRMAGMLQMASAFPLPATATFATITSAYVPGLLLATSPRTFF